MEVTIAILLLFILLAGIRLRRKNKVPDQFPDSWRKVLKEIPFYEKLSQVEKDQFEDEILHFLREVKVTGLDVKMDEKTIVLVAVSAVIPVFKLEGFHYHIIKEIYVVPKNIKTGYPEIDSSGGVMGYVKPVKGGIYMTFSRTSLINGYRNFKDRRSVGLHEFAHVLDYLDGKMDGVPEAFMDENLIKEWKDLVKEKVLYIRKNKTDINPYGGTNRAEFFAVITEYFYENPTRLKKNHPRLYEFLVEIYDFDPLGMKEDDNQRDQVHLLDENDTCPCGSGEVFKNCCWDKRDIRSV